MQPTRWLVDHQHLVPRAGTALDVACGRGRNAIWLAQRGLETLAIDRDAAALEDLRATAQSLGLSLKTEVIDLEGGARRLPAAGVDVIVVVHYLHRPLVPSLIDALRPGGILVYETFTQAQAARGKPTNPAFLLAAGELRTLVAPLELLVEREGEFEGKMLASVIARRPRAPQQRRRP
jgi:SAM-dependent methyltransferase